MSILANQLSNSSAAKWFKALSDREKTLVTWTAIALIGLFLLGYLLPSTLEFRQTKVSTLKVASANLSWMKAYETTARTAGQQGQDPSEGGIVLSKISRSADLHEVELQRIQPVSEGINIELSRQSFDSVLRWLFSLQSDEGATISQVRVMRHGSGLVDARVVVR